MELTILTACAIGIVVLVIGICGVWMRQGILLEKQNRPEIAWRDLSDRLKAMNEERV